MKSQGAPAKCQPRQKQQLPHYVVVGAASAIGNGHPTLDLVAQPGGVQREEVTVAVLLHHADEACSRHCIATA
eukprot:7311646-Prorocentrum_lima.AAC.1